MVELYYERSIEVRLSSILLALYVSGSIFLIRDIMCPAYCLVDFITLQIITRLIEYPNKIRKNVRKSLILHLMSSQLQCGPCGVIYLTLLG